METHVTKLAAATFVLLFARLGPGQDVDIRLARGHLVIVPVVVNGEGPYDFLLDTGATTSVVDRELARELGLSPLQETVIRTAVGTERVPIARVHRMDVGPQSTETVLVLCSKMDGIRSLDDDVRGILGFNFLSRFRYTLDYDSRILRFENRTGIDEVRVAFDPSGRSIVLTTDKLRLSLDTGATSLFLFAERSTGLDIELDPRAIRAVTTSSGRRVSRSGVLGRLVLGETEFERVPVTLLPQTGLESKTDGLIPGTMFSAIHVDHENGYVVLNPTLVSTK